MRRGSIAPLSDQGRVANLLLLPVPVFRGRRLVLGDVIRELVSAGAIRPEHEVERIRLRRMQSRLE